ncbi:MAG TPA: hypothetical protein ENN87_17720 [Phycisphaerales bacterium]|nr:hypothetical protein [Phycisphaerales bacterium]
MYEVLRQFEQAALAFWPPLLILGGAGLVLVGLCVWLAPLWWARAISGLAGACAGACLALFCTDRQPFAVGLMALVGTGFGLFFHRGTLILTGALLAGLMAVVAMTAGPPHEGSMDRRAAAHATNPEELNGPQTATAIAGQVQNLARQVRHEWLRFDPIMKAVPLAVAGGIVVLGLVRVRWAGALSGAILGTCLIGVGLAAALLYKGAQPFTGALEARGLYGPIAAAMVAFGTVVGLVLGPAMQRRKPPPGKEGA